MLLSALLAIAAALIVGTFVVAIVVMLRGRTDVSVFETEEEREAMAYIFEPNRDRVLEKIRAKDGDR